MSQDYTARLRKLMDELHQEAARIETAGRALTDAETRRTAALRQARNLVEQALDVLASVPLPRTGGVMRGDEDSPLLDDDAGPARGPLENTGLAGDDDTPGYGRSGRVRG